MPVGLIRCANCKEFGHFTKDCTWQNHPFSDIPSEVLGLIMAFCCVKLRTLGDLKKINTFWRNGSFFAPVHLAVSSKGKLTKDVWSAHLSHHAVASCHLHIDCNNLTQEKPGWLVKLFADCEHLTSLHISSDQAPGGEIVEGLQFALQSKLAKQLTQLSLRNILATKQKGMLPELRKALQSCSNLKALYLDGFETQLVAGLWSSDSKMKLRHLSLLNPPVQGPNIRPPVVPTAELFKSTAIPSLASFSLECTNVILPELPGLLDGSASLQSFSLTGNQAGAAEAVAETTLFNIVPRLSKLHLCKQRTSLIENCVDTISVSNKLTVLSLEKSGLQAEFGLLLLDMLKRQSCTLTTTLVGLSLSGNPLKSETAAALISFFVTTYNTMQHLRLQACGVVAEVGKLVASAVTPQNLAQKKEPIHIDLSQNDTSASGLRVLVCRKDGDEMVLGYPWSILHFSMPDVPNKLRKAVEWGSLVPIADPWWAKAFSEHN
eukprot:TRINITY_DN67225_c3_g1_i1.p1 TRINITY_DN67225_c3_g1~~TRINITY_DN67225_c3_g1_i1.p1  ORF type:complete len:490 (+),score=13.87 TRINITY_DN67225_c3_g1_i1:59-1528(+)